MLAHPFSPLPTTPIMGHYGWLAEGRMVFGQLMGMPF